MLLVEYTPCGAIVNAAVIQVTLTKLKEAIHCKRPGLLSQGVLLLHDNAWPHTANDTCDLLDFHLFPKLKKHLCGQRFHKDDNAKKAVRDWLHHSTTKTSIP